MFDPKHTYIASDHHFGKSGKTTSEEKDLIDKWNSVVSPDDDVVYAGDFADCSTVSDLIKYINQLNGRSIHLVKGNHDDLPDCVYASLFKSVQDKLEIDGIVIQHSPDLEEKKPQIFGHVHEKSNLQFLDIDKGFCVCQMQHDGKPVLLQDIIDFFNAQSQAEDC